MNNNRRANQRRFVSFFSGALGLDLGLEQAGFQPLAANEYDPVACDTIRRNKPLVHLYASDIHELTATQLKKDLGIPTGEASGLGLSITYPTVLHRIPLGTLQ